MTSPPSPPARDLQRRVEALLTEPPEHASVTVEKRPSDAERARSATFDLTDDELRRVVDDDLKRSLWRPTPDGLTLDWDDPV